VTHNELRNSGLLELYVADACTVEERVLVEGAIASSPELASEVREIEAALEAFAMSRPVKPPTHLRNVTLEAIARLSAAPNVEAAQPAKALVHVVNFRKRYLIAASIGLLVGALPSVYLYTDRTSALQDRDAAIEALAEAKSASSVMASKVSHVEETLDKVTNVNVQRVALPAVVPGGTAFASVFWNKETREVVIDARKLPALEGNEDYQLWAIVDGKPVDLGVIDIAGTSESRLLVKMKSIVNPAMFAITVEPRGGSSSPTLEAMIVAGKVG